MYTTEYDGAIVNSSDFADAMCNKMEQEAAGFYLNEVDTEGCINVQAEIDSRETYQKGIKFAGVLKDHVFNAVSYFRQISEALETADQEVVRRSSHGGGGRSFANGGGER